MIRSGWRVVTREGTEFGRVDEVAGDSNADIFDGLSVAMSALATPRYVPAEQVARITEGEVELSLSAAEAGQLEEYREPATSAQIEADDRGGAAETLGADIREVEAKVVAPIHERDRSLTLIQRLAHAVRRFVSGRR